MYIPLQWVYRQANNLRLDHFLKNCCSHAGLVKLLCTVQALHKCYLLEGFQGLHKSLSQHGLSPQAAKLIMAENLCNCLDWQQTTHHAIAHHDWLVVALPTCKA